MRSSPRPSANRKRLPARHTRGAGAWLLIAASAIARRRGGNVDALAVWLLGRASAAQAISAALLLFLGGLATLAVGS